MDHIIRCTGAAKHFSPQQAFIVKEAAETFFCQKPDKILLQILAPIVMLHLYKLKELHS